MERYKERIVHRKRKTNLHYILRKNGIKQCELAQEADVDNWIVSKLCTGQKAEIEMGTAKRICNALNNILGVDEMRYTLHDLFNE